MSAYSGVGGALGHLRIFEGAYIEIHEVSVTETEVTANNSYAGGLIGAVSRSGDSYLRIFSSQVEVYKRQAEAAVKHLHSIVFIAGTIKKL